MGMEFYAAGWFAVILWFLIFHWKDLKDPEADYTYMPACIYFHGYSSYQTYML